MTWRLLDLFCGAGGCSAGYAAAGFQVVGVDRSRAALRRYPFPAIRMDAMDALAGGLDLDQFDVIHASPPCQPYSRTRHLARAQGHDTRAQDLLAPVLNALAGWSGVWVVENVPGAPLDGVTLCGRAYGLRVKRHRVFASNMLLMSAGCVCGTARPVGVYGRIGDQVPNGGRTAVSVADARDAMGIGWMTWPMLREAIPPAYTAHLGEQIRDYLETGTAPGI